MNKYQVGYRTTPSPGLTYYQGTISVHAEDDSDAEEQALNELQRKSHFPRSLIQITTITRAVRS